MLKRKYEIIGITPKVADLWSKNMRDDIIISADDKTGKVRMHIKLNKLEAFKMRIQMIIYNLKHSRTLKLKRCKSTKHAA